MTPDIASVSVLTVTYNAAEFVAGFLASVLDCDLQDIELEVVVVDNGSTDATLSLVEQEFPSVNLQRNRENNYTSALNIGIATAKGDYIVIANNDATADAYWLQGMLDVLRQYPGAGAVQSKILFAHNGKLNSVGVEEIEHFYFRDIGFEQDDSARYARPAQRQFLSGGSLMLRRQCLRDVGDWDEGFLMYMEDVDYSVRCRKAGWQLMYAPDSVYRHRFHGSASDALCDYFCARNRFLLVAKHFPAELADCIRSSHFYRQQQYDLLYRALLHSALKLCACHDEGIVRDVLPQLGSVLTRDFGRDCSNSFFAQLQLLLGLRRMRVCICHSEEDAATGQTLAGLVSRQMPEAEIDRVQGGQPDASSGVYDILVDLCQHVHSPVASLQSVTADAASASRYDHVLSADAPEPVWQALLALMELEILGEDALPTAVDGEVA